MWNASQSALRTLSAQTTRPALKISAWIHALEPVDHLQAAKLKDISQVVFVILVTQETLIGSAVE